MRFDPKPPHERILNEATRRSRTPGAPARFSSGGQGVSVAPPGSTTVPIEDGTGQYLDGRGALWDVDVWDDPAALWRE